MSTYKQISVLFAMSGLFGDSINYTVFYALVAYNKTILALN